MKTITPSSYRAVLTDILEFEILDELPSIDDMGTVGSMVKMGVRDILLQTTEEDARTILEKVSRHLATYGIEPQ